MDLVYVEMTLSRVIVFFRPGTFVDSVEDINENHVQYRVPIFNYSMTLASKQSTVLIFKLPHTTLRVSIRLTCTFSDFGFKFTDSILQVLNVTFLIVTEGVQKL